MNPSPHADPFAITRRHFFSRSARGLGAMALASLLPRTLGCGPGAQAVGGLPGVSEFYAEGKARHLSFPKRRAVADGFVRLQAVAQ